MSEPDWIAIDAEAERVRILLAERRGEYSRDEKEIAELVRAWFWGRDMSKLSNLSGIWPLEFARFLTTANVMVKRDAT